MPSPLAHALVGVAVHALTARESSELHDPRRAAVVVAAAVVPDLDLLLRFVDGRNHHQAESHSLGVVLVAGLLVAAVAALRRARRPAALGLAAAAGWLSHAALDLLGRDTHPPIGLPALWPLTDAYYKFPWPLFLDIGRTLEWATVVNNTLAIAWEFVLLAPLLALVWRARRRALARAA